MRFAATGSARARILAGALIAASLFVAACGGGDGDGTPTPTPTSTPAETGTPTPAPPDTAYRFVFREHGNAEDIFWRILPSDPSQREKVVTIAHREGHGIVASLSPDGRMMAYLSLPAEAVSEESSQAEAYVLDLKRGSTRLVTKGVDYTFRPLWSPDGQLLFLRRLAGPEILAADVSIVYTKIEREPLEGEPTPTPTKKPTPVPSGETPRPTPVPEDPIKTILKAKYSQVRSFIPIGWADDNRSLYFVQVNGGLQGATLVGAYFPATTESIAKEATPTPDPAATPTPTPDPAAPTPDPAAPTPPPTPTPTPNSKFVLQLTDAAASDFSLSGDLHKVAFASSGLVDGEFVSGVSIADLKSMAVTPIQEDGLPQGNRLGPVWHPDSNHITVGVLPFGGHAGGAVIVPLQLAQPQFLAEPVSGFDIPRLWSPDAAYLAVTNWSGPDLANTGDPSLDLVSPTGFRVRIAQGAGYATADAAIGWMAPS